MAPPSHGTALVPLVASLVEDHGASWLAPRLAEGEPDTPGDLWKRLTALGAEAIKRGDTEVAGRLIDAAGQVAEDRAERPPWRRRLATTRRHQGDLSVLRDDFEGAARHYRADLEILDALAARDPDDADRQTNLVVSLYRLGMLDGRRAPLLRARAIMEGLAEGRRVPREQAQSWLLSIGLALAAADD